MEKLREKYISNNNIDDISINKINSLKYDIGTNENFNGLSTEELNEKKAYMDKFYEKHNIKVGDKVLAYFTDGARHFGMAIEEQIIEK